MIATTDLLWSLRGVDLETIIATIEARSDAECSAAFEHHRATLAFGEREMLNAIRLATEHLGTGAVMAVMEPIILEKIQQDGAAATGVPLVPVAACAAVELYALLVEGFVRMGHRGLSYPQNSPRDLLSERR